jgi:hypothetical protein
MTASNSQELDIDEFTRLCNGNLGLELLYNLYMENGCNSDILKEIIKGWPISIKDFGIEK